jgi:hypothetical protein
METEQITRLGQSILNIASAVDRVKEASPPCACSFSEFEETYRRAMEKALLCGDRRPFVVADPLHPTFFNRTGFWKSVSYMGFPQ